MTCFSASGSRRNKETAMQSAETENRYRTPRTHVRRAARSLRQSIERSGHELSEGLRRAAKELRNAAQSARQAWRDNK
jgi:hypothetical protein